MSFLHIFLDSRFFFWSGPSRSISSNHINVCTFVIHSDCQCCNTFNFFFAPLFLPLFLSETCRPPGPFHISSYHLMKNVGLPSVLEWRVRFQFLLTWRPDAIWCPFWGRRCGYGHFFKILPTWMVLLVAKLLSASEMKVTELLTKDKM